MIIQKVPPLARRIDPNPSVPDIPHITLSGRGLSIQLMSGAVTSEAQLPKISLDGINYRVAAHNEVVTSDTIFLAAPDEPVNGFRVEIFPNDGIVTLSGDFRIFCEEEGKVLLWSDGGKVRFENASMYVEFYLGQIQGTSFVNTPTFFVKKTQTEFVVNRWVLNCSNLKELDMRGVSAVEASQFDLSGEFPFYQMQDMEITILAPKEWETYNGGIAYENIYVQCQNKGVTANFKFYEDNETYKS